MPIAEVLVVDDASTDESLERIARLSEPRIKIFPSKTNFGGAETLNRGIAEATGQLIAICNSDDVWEPTKIERQLNVLDSMPNVGAVFSNVSWIDENGDNLSDGRDFDEIFSQPNRSRHLWLRDLFEKGNCLCHPSILIKKNLYEQIGPYDNRFRQLPDYKMWLALLQKSQIHVLQDRLVRFRVHSNTSKPSESVSTRNLNEFSDIALNFITDLGADDFVAAFGSRRPLHHDEFDLAVEKVLYLWSKSNLDQRFAYWIAGNLAMKLLANEAGRKSWSQYGLSLPEFHALQGLQSPWATPRQPSTYTSTEVSILEKIGRHINLPDIYETTAPENKDNEALPERRTPPSSHRSFEDTSIEKRPPRTLRTARYFLLAFFHHPLSRTKRRSYVRMRIHHAHSL